MSIDWEKSAESGFAGLDLEQLKEACNVFGITVGPNAKETFIREKLCATVGAPAKLESEAPKKAASRSIGNFDPMPNLTPNGKWGGRMHRVQLTRTADVSEKQVGVPLGWNGNTIYVFYDRPMDIPEPHYSSLCNTKGNHIITKRSVREDGSVETRQVTVPFQAIPYQDLGITPGTEDLPASGKEYWQRQAVKHNYFADTSRNVLITINSSLREPQGKAFYKDLTTDDIRWEVLSALGMESEMEEAA